MNSSVTIIVATYNSNIGKLCSTLKSIVMQKGINIEIVVTDDGSDNYNAIQTSVRDFCKANNFSNYKIIHSLKNQGIIRNVLNGVKVSSFEYVKVISPGDVLFDVDVMGKWLRFTEDNKCDISGGYAVWYSIDNNKINLLKRIQMPQNPNLYSANFNLINRIEAVIYSSDVFHGVGMLVKRDIFVSYLSKMIENGIVYAEDLFFRLAVLENKKIMLYPNNVVWYECGCGISTLGDDRFTKLLQLDVKKIHTVMEEIIINNKKEYASYIDDLYFNDVNSVGAYRFIRLLFHPKIFKHKVMSKINRRYTDTNVNMDFLRLCIL